MEVTLRTDLVDEVLSLPVYGTSDADKRRALLAAVQQELVFYFDHCETYRRFCVHRGFDPRAPIQTLEDIPPLPVQAFKEIGDQLVTVGAESLQARLRSSATTGVPSVVSIDRVTAKRQARALASVMVDVTGQKRRPFWVFDVDPASAVGLTARGAATRGFLSVARSVDYVVAERQGSLVLDDTALESAHVKAETEGRPICLFGFTYVLYSVVLEPLLAAGRTIALPAGSRLLHIGGWKKLAHLGISSTTFAHAAQSVFGLSSEDVVDIYGFTEQIGAIYPECPAGGKHVPAFAEIVIRDQLTLQPVADGTPGLIEMVTPIPHSYAGAAVLTDDVGVVESRGRCTCGRSGTRFRVLGRTQNAELRGCGDVLAEKVARPAAASSLERTRGDARVLFAGGKACDRPLSPDDVPALLADLRKAQAQLARLSCDDIIALLGAAAEKWADPEHALASHRQHGLSFASQWARPERLQRTADASLGSRAFLDGFRPDPAAPRRLLRAQPRGLSVHWLAGNAPTIGLLSAILCLVTKNASLLKAPSGQTSLLPNLLADVADARVTTPGGRCLDGRTLVDALTVVQFGRERRDLSEALSSAADVRVAWGGAEAVRAVMQMPRRYGSEDLVFGPRLSLMIVGRECLTDESGARRVAKRAATDASAFEQYACASPHAIFVEQGGVISPDRFATFLAEEMDRALVRLPKQSLDGAAAGRIQSARLRHEASGRVIVPGGLQWTILFDNRLSLPEPVYNRTVFVKSVPDVMDVVTLLQPEHQTVGIELTGRRRLAFAEVATQRGVDRLPTIGHMTDFDAPWDGVFEMSRLVRWVSTGAPI